MRWLTKFLWFQVQINSYSKNWNTPCKSLIVTAGDFQKCNEDTLERYAIKLCFKLGKNATETYGMQVHAAGGDYFEGD